MGNISWSEDDNCLDIMSDYNFCHFFSTCKLIFRHLIDFELKKVLLPPP